MASLGERAPRLKMGVLARILDNKRTELPELAARVLPSPPPRRALELAPRDGRVRLICEIKRRSPSAGALSTFLSVAERAAAYERAGASMLSVLTDARFFDGDFSHLTEARRATSLPILCKDFIIDERQLDAARAFGADAALLIVRCLTPREVTALVAAARARDLEPFVEVATVEEVRIALDAGSTLIGVNARDLDTLAMDAARAAEIIAQIPQSVVRVHLSGLAKPEDVAKLRTSGVDAALVGEVLMRQDDPEPLLRSLIAAGRP